jgi:hypothetical protein
MMEADKVIWKSYTVGVESDVDNGVAALGGGNLKSVCTDLSTF